MPTYGYRCNSCKHTFEVIQSINDKPIEECPKCSDRVSKLFYPVGIAFKGSGFHVNDYKSPRRLAAEKRNKDNSGITNPPKNGKSDCTSCSKTDECAKETSTI